MSDAEHEDDRGPSGAASALTVTSTARKAGKLVVDSPAMGDALDALFRIALTDVTITLLGETGTGKDVLAHAIHAHSPRANQPFAVFDCGSVAASLAESELFGHEKGSFTGALTQHPGAFERANSGTLFLDEVGELPLGMQPRLLRVLENRCVRRLGGSQDIAVNVRVVAATNRNLQAEVAAGRFREDLYYRLAAAVVKVPPLRERLDDLPVLVPRLLLDLGYGHVEVAEVTYEALRSRPWLGNVRELKNALACAVAFVDQGILEPEHLKFAPLADGDSAVERLPLAGKALKHLERMAIQQTLAQTGGNKVQAAQALGIAASTLYEKLKKYGLS